MTTLIWGAETQKHYESGVDRGVFYPSVGPGVVWNGIVSVDESFSGGETESYYYDGVKFLDIVSPKTYSATITAFSAPEEFGEALGDLHVIPGFILTRQARARFGFSYRTLRDGGRSYKIHLVYNVLASPNGRDYNSVDPSAKPNSLNWKINAIPVVRNTHRPTAHFTFDTATSDPESLQALEAILYGTDKLEPRLPSVDELLDIVADWSPLLIDRQSISGLSPLVPGTGDLYRTQAAGILRALPTTRLYKDPANDGLYRME